MIRANGMRTAINVGPRGKRHRKERERTAKTHKKGDHHYCEHDLEGDGESPRDISGRVEKAQINPIRQHDSLESVLIVEKCEKN